KVMLVASTHVAVDNVLEGLAEMDLPIVPVRVGLEKKISPKTKDYTVGRQISSFCKKTSSYLNSEKKGRILSPAQEDLLSIVNKSEFAMNEGELRELEELVVKSANLVCGTTIGILQYPPLKYAIEAGGVHEDEMFDYLILDEASKTTFPEFLVPAMYAKKWIIVGDPKQLTPFMESDAFTNVLAFLGKRVEALLVLCYKLKKEADRVGVIVSEDEIFDARIEQQATALGLDFFNVHKEIGPYIKLGLKDALGQRETMRLFGARLIFGRENELREIEKDLPPRVDYFVGNRPEDIFSFQDVVKRQEYLVYNSESIKTSKPRSITKQQSMNWTKEVAQKLIRFRDVDDVTFKRKDKDASNDNEDGTKGENKYITQIKDLLPSFPVYRIHDG
nr:AAA domain-containing protein [Candidatus Sigynarchaeota archaeon]